jgi:transcriptional regulator with XRE-family HTH domain
MKNQHPAFKQHSVRELRRKKGLNQLDFWSRVYTTQSGGSRYEGDRNIPKAVRMLVYLVHELEIDVEQINPENAKVIRALLAGELDEDKLLQTAELARTLMEKVTILGGSADALSHEAQALAGKVAGQQATPGAALQ